MSAGWLSTQQHHRRQGQLLGQQLMRPAANQVSSPVRTAGQPTPSMRCSARTAATTSLPGPCPGHWLPLSRRTQLVSSRHSQVRPPPLTTTGDGSSPSAETFDWVAEVWIDPAWYEAQQSPDRMPSPGLPVVVPLRSKSILIGRTSRSRNIHPQIDCESDSGVSRRQTQLTTDGTRWWVEDLESANGTFVAPATGALPSDPIPVGVKHELAADDRIYVGAWTRIVIRRATEDEMASLA